MNISQLISIVLFLVVGHSMYAQMPPLAKEYVKREAQAPIEVKNDLKELRARGKKEKWTFQVGYTGAYDKKLGWITGLVMGEGLDGPSELKLEVDKLSLFTGKRLTELENLKRFDLREYGVITIPKDQDVCGCNWAFVATSLAETALLIEDRTLDKHIDLSEQYVLDCSDAGDGGKGSITKALDYLKGAYLPKEDNFRAYQKGRKQCMDPVNKNSEFYKIGDFKRVWGFVDSEKISEMILHVKYAIYRYGAVSGTISTNDEFRYYAGGVYNYGYGDLETSATHHIQFVGWDDDKHAWLIKNSWGTDWGEEGFAWVDYETLNIGASTICVFNKEELDVTNDAIVPGINDDKGGDGGGGSVIGGNDKIQPVDGDDDRGNGDENGNGDEDEDDINKTKLPVPDPPTVKSSEHTMDAALYHNGHAYFFSGNMYSRFTGTTINKDYPRKISDGWKGLPSNFQEGIDAAFFYPPTGQIYFFKGHEYVRFTPASNTVDWEEGREELVENQETNNRTGNGYIVDTKYPLDLPGGWKGLPEDFYSGIDAAIHTNGLTYFFKGNKYVRFRGTTIDAGYETAKSFPGGWKIDDSFYENVGAAFYYPDSGKNYFFKGNKYIRLKTYQMDKAPTNLPGGWKGLTF